MAAFREITYASDLPDGVARDPTQPYEATMLVVTCVITLPLAAVLVAIRLYTRYFITANVGADDFTMLGALLMASLLVGFVGHMLQYGLGKHMWNVPQQPDLFPIWMIDQFLTQLFFLIATILSRCSILLFYLRIFITRDMKWAVWSVFAFIMCAGTACLLVSMFMCDPVSASWTLAEMTTAKCINRPYFYYTQAGLFILIDFLTVIVPMPKLKALRMPLKQKVGVGMMLVIGSAACIVSIYRLRSIYTLQSTNDLTYETTPAMMWCVLELNLSIIGGSMPTLKPFLQRHVPRLFSFARSRIGSSKTNYHNSPESVLTFRRFQGGSGLGRSAKSGTAAFCSMSRKKDAAALPVSSSDDLPLQGTIIKTVHYGYEHKEDPVSDPHNRHEERIRPIVPALVRAPHA